MNELIEDAIKARLASKELARRPALATSAAGAGVSATSFVTGD
jgi:hypothetical protein